MAMPEQHQSFPYEHASNNPSDTVAHLSEVPEIQVPQSKLRRVSRLEKLIFSLLIVTFLGLSIATIRMTTNVTRQEEAITAIDASKKESLQNIEKLEQEKNELLRADHLKKIAEKEGLKLHEDNIRTIK